MANACYKIACDISKAKIRKGYRQTRGSRGKMLMEWEQKEFERQDKFILSCRLLQKGTANFAKFKRKHQVRFLLDMDELEPEAEDDDEEEKIEP